MKKFYLILYLFFTIISLKAQNPDWTNYTLIFTECKDYSDVATARDYILKFGGNVAIIGSKNVMLGWIDPSIASQLIGHYGITAIHYKPIDLSIIATSDRQTIQTVAFFNSATSGVLKKQSLDEKDKTSKKMDYFDGLPHPAISYDDYIKNLEQNKLDIQNLKKKNQLLTFKSDGSLLTGNSDVMVGTVAVAVFLVESNGAIDPNLYTWSSADEDSMYQRTLKDLNWWSNMATKYGKNVTFNIIPYYHTDPVSQQPYEPILHSSSEDSLWIGSIMNKLGFQIGSYPTRVEAYNTWLRSNYHTDWAYTIFFAYNPSPAPHSFTDGYGGYAYLGGPYTQILFTWFYDRTVAHESGHIFWAPDEYYVAGYGGCGDGATNTKSGFPNGNCVVANVNSADCMMKNNIYTLCAFSPAHIGWITEVPQYFVRTNPPGLLIFVNENSYFGGVQKISPQEFPWGGGSKVEISVVTPQTINGRRYDFLSWNDGGAQSHSITIPNTSTSYTANFSLANEAPQTWMLYQKSNALPTPNVNVVSIDLQGNVWVGTDGGLSKFDGENWKTYNTANSGIPFNIVTSIVADAEGNKWVGMAPSWDGSTNVGGGLAKFDGTNWTVYSTSNSGLPSNDVRSIVIDNSGNKWIGTAPFGDGSSYVGGGLAKFDGTNWTVYSTSNSGLPHDWINTLAIDGSGNKWIGTYGGLAKFDGTTWTVYNSSNSELPDYFVYSIAIDGSGNKWIGTGNGGLAKFDGTTWTVYNTSNSGLPSNSVGSIAIDGSGNKWFGTAPSWDGSAYVGGGIAKFDGTNWIVYKTSNSALPSNDVKSIVIDISGSTWIGVAPSWDGSTYVSGGLAKFDGTNWEVYTTSNFGLPSNSVNSIVIDITGNKWIGTQDGLAKYDGKSWTYYNSLNSGLPSNGVHSIAIDASGNKWIGTANGFTKFDGTSWTVYSSSNSGLPDNFVRSIAIDVSGNKWIGTVDGLAKFDGTYWSVYKSSNSGLPNNDVNSIAIDASGNKWIGTSDGLVKYDGTYWTVYKSSNSGLPDNLVYSIAIDGSGNKWIGTVGYGLAKYDGTNWTVYSSLNSGLPDNTIWSILIDGLGNKWIGTVGGLAKYVGTNYWTVYNSLNSGLPNDRVTSIAIDGSGNKWIGTGEGGLAVYNEDGLVSVEENITNITPTEFLLSQNYPNPFNPTTVIRYSIPRLSKVILKIYDILGREVEKLVDEEKSPGQYQVQFDAKRLSSGVYFYRIQAGSFVETKKLILIK